MSAAHAQGFIHRDIKPANLLLEEGTNRLKIADFGLAQATLDPSETAMPGQTAGTPSFLAPELLGDGAATAQRLVQPGLCAVRDGQGEFPIPW